MTKTKILIVEDEAVIGMHIQNTLIKLGYEVCDCVTSGEEAIRMASELKPDLILMDIILQSGMDGIEAAKIIKDTHGIPVVYMTGNADVQTITRARETSPHGYVLKPINVLHLFSTIDTVLHRNELETSLRESDEKLRRIIENSKDGIVLVNEKGSIIEWNIGMERNSGLLKSDVMGRQIWEVQYDMLDKDEVKGFTKESFRRIYQQLLNGVQGEFTNQYIEGRIKRQDGSKLIVEDLVLQLPTMKGTMICIFQRDITERRLAENALRENEERFRALLDNLQDIVVILDATGIVKFENPSTPAILGYSLLGRNVFDIIHPDDLAIVKNDFMEVIEKTNPHRPTLLRVHRQDGSWLYIEALATNLFDNSIIRGMMVVGHNVNLAMKTQKALLESEQRYHTLFDQSPVGVFMFDKNMVLTDCNERLVEIMHTSRDKLIGIDLTKLRNNTVVVPKALETLSGRVVSYEGPYLTTTSDVTVWITLSATPLRDEQGDVIGGMAVIEDISARHMAQERLRSSEERNRLLVENANESIAVLQDRRFVFTNPQFTKLSGYTEQELGSRDFTEFIHHDDKRTIEERYQRRINGDRTPFTYDLRFVSKEGDTKWTELNSVLFTWGDKPAVLLFIRDITERKQAEEERRKMESQIQQTQKLESLGVLAGGIAHDFNNLLMAILGNIDLALLELKPSAPVRENLLEAAKASQRAADLCRQMLAYSGRGRFKSESLDLNEIIEDMSHMLEVSISKKAILRYNYAAGLPPIEADATQMRQIIMNLVINASDAIGEKSGSISISTGMMECDRYYLSETWLNEKLPEGKYVYLEVADTGCGMDHEMMPKIFDPFFTTKFAGRGLGLAAVFGIVRGHKGAIKVYSEKGKGTTFKILLPASEGIAEHVESVQANGGEWRGSGTILLADDEETIRTLGRRMLERLGFSVLTAANGREALDLFQNHAEEITCIILDLTMPHMDGEEAFRELRRFKKNVPVIMSSGYNEQDIIKRFAGKGIDGFIQKPYQLAELSVKLKEILG